MTRSELYRLITSQQDDLSSHDVKSAIDLILDTMKQHLAAGQRIEIRGFASFEVRERRSYLGRNPKTGENIAIGKRLVPHCKFSLKLLKKINNKVPIRK